MNLILLETPFFSAKSLSSSKYSTFSFNRLSKPPSTNYDSRVVMTIACAQMLQSEIEWVKVWFVQT